MILDARRHPAPRRRSRTPAGCGLPHPGRGDRPRDPGRAGPRLDRQGRSHRPPRELRRHGPAGTARGRPRPGRGPPLPTDAWAEKAGRRPGRQRGLLRARRRRGRRTGRLDRRAAGGRRRPLAQRRTHGLALRAAARRARRRPSSSTRRRTGDRARAGVRAAHGRRGRPRRASRTPWPAEGPARRRPGHAPRRERREPRSDRPGGAGPAPPAHGGRRHPRRQDARCCSSWTAGSPAGASAPRCRSWRR